MTPIGEDHVRKRVHNASDSRVVGSSPRRIAILSLVRAACNDCNETSRDDGDARNERGPTSVTKLPWNSANESEQCHTEAEQN